MGKNALKEFYELTIKDPLFAAEGMNIPHAFEALDNLEAITRQLHIIDTSFFGSIHFLFHPLTQILHPFQFLRKFVHAEKIRREFIADPHLSSATRLITAYFSTVYALEKDLYTFRSAVLDAQKNTLKKNPSVISEYNFYKRAVTFEEFINSIDLMIENAKQLHDEIQKRRNMLFDSFQNTRIQSLKKSTSLIDPIPYLVSTKKKSSKKISDIELTISGRDFIYYIKKQYGGVKTEIYGPIFYKLSNFDSTEKLHEFFVAIIKDKKNQPKYFYPILADKFHYVELAKEKYTFNHDRSFYEALVRQHIPYWYQPATSFYFSSDISFFSDLATIIDLKQRPFLQKDLLLSEKSSMLDVLLWTGYYHNLGFLRSIQQRKKLGRNIGVWHYLLIGRSYPSLYYLPFNNSVWRLKEKPNFLGHVTSHKSKYITQIPTNLSQNQLHKIFRGGIIRAVYADQLLNITY